MIIVIMIRINTYELEDKLVLSKILKRAWACRSTNYEKLQRVNGKMELQHEVKFFITLYHHGRKFQKLITRINSLLKECQTLNRTHI
ncbi:unnamed protein product, partial [Acanthoscelides obtectus]